MKKVIPYLLLLFFCFGINYLYANEPTKSDKSLGYWYTEFRFSVPPCLEYADDEDNEIIIYVVPENKTDITLEIPGKAYKETKSAEAYQICSFSLSPLLGQCYRRKANDTVPQEKVYPGYGIHIYAEEPIIASCFINYKHAVEAINLLPVTVLSREYIVSTYNDNNSGPGEYYPAECAIVAIYDKTKATLILGGNDSTSTTGGLLPGNKLSKTLNAGDVWLISSAGENADLSGSKIITTKPAAVTSGNYAASIPGTGEPLNYIADMLIPENTSGEIYYIPNIPGRKNPPLIRVYAREENTTVYRNGNKIGYLEDAGGLISKAYLEIRLNEGDAENQHACISADNPVMVHMYNPGYQDDGNGFSNNSPFMMNMIPLVQYENEKTFVIPDFGGGAEHYLNFVFEKDENGGTAGGAMIGKYKEDDFAWNYISDIDVKAYDFEYKAEGKKFAFRNIKIGTPGVYKIKSDVPFALYAYGHYNDKSYGYPIIGDLGIYERGDTVPPEIHISRSCHGEGCGYIMEMPDNDSVRTNLAVALLTDNFNGNFLFEVDDFEAEMDRQTGFEIDVKTFFEDAEATIIAMDRSGNEVSLHLTYTARQYFMTPNILDFGTLETGDSKTLELKIFNRSTEKVQKPSRFHLLSDYTDTLDNQGFVLEDISMPLTLEVGDTVYAKCTFTAGETGVFTDSVALGDTCRGEYVTFLKAKVVEPGSLISKSSKILPVYPNPADGEIKITLPDSCGIIKKIEVYTVDGRNVYSREFPSYGDYTLIINTKSFAEGYYCIRVETMENEYTCSFILQR